LAAIAPDESENATQLFQKLPNANEFLHSFLENIYSDSAELSYYKPDKIRELRHFDCFTITFKSYNYLLFFLDK
jgi:hypothetical protein